MSYTQITPSHGSYSAAQTINAMGAGRFFCDAVAHHQAGGCPNPRCFRHVPGVQDDPTFKEPRLDALRRGK